MGLPDQAEGDGKGPVSAGVHSRAGKDGVPAGRGPSREHPANATTSTLVGMCTFESPFHVYNGSLHWRGAL